MPRSRKKLVTKKDQSTERLSITSAIGRTNSDTHAHHKLFLPSPKKHSNVYDSDEEAYEYPELGELFLQVYSTRGPNGE